MKHRKTSFDNYQLFYEEIRSDLLSNCRSANLDKGQIEKLSRDILTQEKELRKLFESLEIENK